MLDIDIDGVELCVAKIEELNDVLSSEEHTKFLRKYSYNTLHTPFKDFLITEKNKDELIGKIELLAKKINAKFVVFHMYNLSTINMINNIKSPYTIENTLSGDWHSEKIISFFNENKDVKMTLDISHALHYGREEFELLVNKLRDRIFTVQLSNIVDEKHHKQFLDHSQKLNYIMEKLPDDIILTIEENFDNYDDIEKEIQLIRSMIDEK